MYSIVTTSGFIINSRPYGEAGKIFSIFTRDLGLVMAIAQGIRLEKSKLRYHAQTHYFGSFSFVKGGEFWRLTSALPLNYSNTVGYAEKPSGKQSIALLASLLNRLLHGEGAHPELFDCVFEHAKFSAANYLTEKQARILESLTVIRLLHRLGYVGEDFHLNGHIQSNEISRELLDNVEGKRTIINNHINKALRESHL